MILRLVYSFFFFSLVTGNQRLEDTKKTARTAPCENKICVCQEQLDSKSGQIPLPSISPHHQESHTIRPPLRVEEGHYGFSPRGRLISAPGYISSNPGNHIETKRFDVEVVSDSESPSYQVPRPVQYIDEETTQYTEKTICFTPRMVHRMVKAALEYVRQIPADINNIIDKIDQELNRMSGQDSIEEHIVQKPLYPLDTRTIFQILNKPNSESKTNLILKYELPSVQEPQCREALEKLIEIAYNVYLKLEQHPQCREYLYRFASHQPEDRPKGHLEYGPDLKSLIASILEQIDKHKPRPPPDNRPDYYNPVEIDIPIPELPIPQIHEIEIPQIHEYNIPQPNEHKMPQPYDYDIPQPHDYNRPEPNDYNVPQIHEYNINIPQIHEFDIPQNQEINRPHVHEFDIPEIHETIIPEPVPLQPEETVNVLIKLLQNNDYAESSNLFDRVLNIVEENQNNFHPQIFNILITLLNAQKNKHIPRFNDIFLLLLDSEKNKQWPWSENITEHILSYLIPDQTGNVDSRIIDIILNLYNKPTNEKSIEYILSLLRPIKEGNLDSKVQDLILNLINSHQNNFLPSEYVDILLKLLKPTPNGVVIDTKEIDIINNLSRWNELGLTPNHLDELFSLLKPDINGITDNRAIDIIHLLLTRYQYIGPKNLNFILSFLYPVNGIINTRRLDIIHFLLNNVLPHKYVHIIFSLLHDNGPDVLNSRFLEILLLLSNNRLLTPEFLETVIALLSDEVNGQLDDNQVKTFIFQLVPFKQSHPKIVVDILSLLNQGGMHNHIVEWLQTVNNNADIPNRDVSPSNLNALLEQIKIIEQKQREHDYRTPDGGYQTNSDNGAPNNDLVNKLLKILEMGERELGVVELTYMLKHEKPLVYQPVYYVKYRLPILSFISNMKTLLLENPNLTADPMKLLQELIVVSNVTEVSPNLQGYPKEEILKLTFNDGDLVQAKILDEQNMKLNEQITYVHGLNADISPEEILQLNRVNEAKYYPNVLQFRGVHPDKVTIHGVDKIVEFPTIHYQQYQTSQGVPYQTQRHTVQFMERSNQNQNLPQPNNAQLRSPN